MPRPAISIIIPTLNEAAALPRTIMAVRAQRTDVTVEVIVADGGSRDGTPELAATMADQFLGAPRGRAKQMNAGAVLARGDILMFLHADTLLAPGAVDAVVSAVARSPRVVGGALRFALDDAAPALRLVAWGVNLRSRCFGLPYGDQALFIRRVTFTAMGGYRDLPIMEDVDLVRRMRRHGQVVIAAATAVTSARRWRDCGLIRTTAANGLALTLFTVGVSPFWIRSAYDAA